MDFDRSKHNVIKYLPTNNDENIWGMSISGIGFQSIDPKGSYPLKGHPIGYTFNPDRGRIIDEFALVYIVKGEGTFASINCFEKKISKGDAFFIFPGQWHSYQPIANIGWDEYYVTFQGDYFEKLLNGIINRANPIFHIGMNDQIVKHFGEMLDCARAQKSGFQAVLAGITMHTIGLIYSINKNQDYGSVSMQKIQEACVLMRENIYDKFTPEDIAESINMSYSNLRKSFKRYGRLFFLLFQEQNRHKPTLLPKRNRKAAGKSQEELTLKEALNQKPRPNLCHSCPSISSQQRKVE